MGLVSQSCQEQGTQENKGEYSYLESRKRTEKLGNI